MSSIDLLPDVAPTKVPRVSYLPCTGKCDTARYPIKRRCSAVCEFGGVHGADSEIPFPVLPQTIRSDSEVKTVRHLAGYVTKLLQRKGKSELIYSRYLYGTIKHTLSLMHLHYPTLGTLGAKLVLASSQVR